MWKRAIAYFHGPGYYELSGEDYCGLFRLGRAFSDDVLPPYIEIVRFDAGPRLKGDDFAAKRMVNAQAATEPGGRERNPWLTFGERLSRDIPTLTEGHRHLLPRLRVRDGSAVWRGV